MLPQHRYWSLVAVCAWCWRGRLLLMTSLLPIHGVRLLIIVAKMGCGSNNEEVASLIQSIGCRHFWPLWPEACGRRPRLTASGSSLRPLSPCALILLLVLSKPNAAGSYTAEGGGSLTALPRQDAGAVGWVEWSGGTEHLDKAKLSCRSLADSTRSGGC